MSNEDKLMNGDCSRQEECLKDIRKMQNEALKEPGWYIHYVPSDEGGEYADIHTHGMMESLEHKNFQIIVPVSISTAKIILNNMGFKIRNGKTFKDGQRDSEVLQGYDVIFREIECEDGEKLLRILFPDDKGRLPGEESCEEYYNEQLTYRDFAKRGEFSEGNK